MYILEVAKFSFSNQGLYQTSYPFEKMSFTLIYQIVYQNIRLYFLVNTTVTPKTIDFLRHYKLIKFLIFKFCSVY